jgi:hypothetical protein
VMGWVSKNGPMSMLCDVTQFASEKEIDCRRRRRSAKHKIVQRRRMYVA